MDRLEKMDELCKNCREVEYDEKGEVKKPEITVKEKPKEEAEKEEKTEEKKKAPSWMNTFQQKKDKEAGAFKF